MYLPSACRMASRYPQLPGKMPSPQDYPARKTKQGTQRAVRLILIFLLFTKYVLINNFICKSLVWLILKEKYQSLLFYGGETKIFNKSSLSYQIVKVGIKTELTTSNIASPSLLSQAFYFYLRSICKLTKYTKLAILTTPLTFSTFLQTCVLVMVQCKSSVSGVSSCRSGRAGLFLYITRDSFPRPFLGPLAGWAAGRAGLPVRLLAPSLLSRHISPAWPALASSPALHTNLTSPGNTAHRNSQFRIKNIANITVTLPNNIDLFELTY